MLERLRIVLVSPSGPANVGAVCRAMANMGLAQLVIVAPRCRIDDPQAVAYAAHGERILRAARIVPDIAAGLHGCLATFATTAREGLYRKQASLTPDEAARRAVQRAAGGDAAFLFGPENHGLVNSDLLEVDHVVSIPADPAYPVLNLAAAVMVMCYELRKAALAAAQPEWAEGAEAGLRIAGGVPAGMVAPAPDERKAAMFRTLFEALDRIGFFFGPNPDHLKYALRHLYGRAGLSINECDILTGMARQILWHVEKSSRRGAENTELEGRRVD